MNPRHAPRPLIVAAAALAALAAACASTSKETTGMTTLSGSVFYRERIRLPPGSVIFVGLEDVSRADAPADVLASVMVTAEGGPPYPFRLDYDAARIEPRLRYGLRARVEHEGRLLFINDTHIDPFANGPTGPVEVLVVQVAGRDAVPLTGTRWTLVELEGEPVPPAAPGRTPYLVLDRDGDRVHGYGGCNGFTGSYTVQGGAIKLSGLASTLMACADGMEREKVFFAMLPRVSRIQVAGDTLVLYAEGKPAARFRADADQ